MTKRTSIFMGIGVIAALSTVAPPAMAATSEPACVEVNRIDHTKIVDDQTILFYLVGGKVLQNKLDYRCFGLKNNTKGISYVVNDNEICGNLQSFRVRDTGEVCDFGAFTPYVPPAPAH